MNNLENNKYPKVYRYKLFWRIVFVLLSLGCLVGFIVSRSNILASVDIDSLFVNIGLGVIYVACLLWIVVVLREKLIIKQDRFVNENIFGKKEILFNEVIGYKKKIVYHIDFIGEGLNYIIFSENKKINVIDIFEKDKETFKFIESNFKEIK